MRVLELFSGIGGLHWALKMTGIDFEVVAAVEINTTVCQTYVHNFPDVKLWNRNIESLTAEEINKLEVDAILMSPPCQPFCRTGLGEGSKDSRSSPLNHLLDILPSVHFKYIFLENVHGFESSDAHKQLLDTLDKCNFSWVEFLLTPSSFNVPNSRLRYYLIGRHKSIPWSLEYKYEDGILTDIPPAAGLNNNYIYRRVVETQETRWSSYKYASSLSGNAGNDLHHERILNDVLENSAEMNGYLVPSRVIVKYINAIDIVQPKSNQSCCFTKAYSHYLTGTGSLLDIGLDVNDIKTEDRKLRYFTPKEIARLMCYPEEFMFPSDQTKKQRYRALGNSVNVYVVAIVLSFLFYDNAASINTGL